MRRQNECIGPSLGLFAKRTTPLPKSKTGPQPARNSLFYKALSVMTLLSTQSCHDDVFLKEHFD